MYLSPVGYIKIRQDALFTQVFSARFLRGLGELQSMRETPYLTIVYTNRNANHIR